MTIEQTGRCHCGAASSSFSEQPELTFFCHCENCQRTSGSPFSVELMVADESYETDGELTTYTVIGESGQPVHRRACAKCGSSLFLECQADPGYVFVKAGALADRSVFRPEMQIFVSHKQPWIKLDHGLPQYDRMTAQ